MAARKTGFDLISHSPDQTRQLGAALGRRLQPGDLVLFSGPLGSGKTTFIQGLALGMGIESNVTSPTFILVMEHSGARDGEPVTLYHVDLYRLSGDPDEIEDFGFDEYLDDPQAVTVIEWPQRAVELLPAGYLLAEFSMVADTKRRIRLIPRGKRYEELVSDLRAEAGSGRG